MRLTPKQYELLRVISAGNGENDPADLDEILSRVRYETTKPSLQFSIRIMIGHGFIFKKGIQKRRGRNRQVLEATKLGHDHMITSCTTTGGADDVVELGSLGPQVVDLSI